jgi:nucleotide-binding universal stress UspA family protein
MIFETVVVPIDRSRLSRQAVPAAAAIAAAGPAKIRLVIVAHNDGELASSYDRAHEAAGLLPPELTSTVDVFGDGDPAGVLLDIAADARNVLCFGSHDHTRLVCDLLGSVGSRVMEQTSHPFILVGPNGSAPAATELARLEVASLLDGGDQSFVVEVAGGPRQGHDHPRW